MAILSLHPSEVNLCDCDTAARLKFNLGAASSNAAHNVIASLALPADRSQLMAASASGKPPLLITQNFDGLSFRALNALASQFDPAELKIARECIIEMHGSINKTVCVCSVGMSSTASMPNSLLLSAALPKPTWESW